MKKVLFASAVAVALVACTSCSKTCHCVASYDSFKRERTITLSDGEKCSYYNTSVTLGGHEASYKCTPQLF